MDAIFTWISGEKFCSLPEVQVFLKSVESLDFDGNCVVFTHDMPVEFRKNLLQRGFDVVDVDPQLVKLVVRDRFLAFHQHIAKYPKQYKRIILTDSKDVLFQTNPFSLLQKTVSFDSFLAFGSEGGCHIQSEWNSLNQIKHQGNIQQGFFRPFHQSPILNSGFIAGSSAEIKNLSMLIWSTSLSVPVALSEQAALNYLWFYLQNDPSCLLFDPNVSSLVLTGEGVKNKWLLNEPRFKKGRICRVMDAQTEEPFCVFHQWERTVYKDIILEAYNV